MKKPGSSQLGCSPTFGAGLSLCWDVHTRDCSSGLNMNEYAQEAGKGTFGLDTSNSHSLGVLLITDPLWKPNVWVICLSGYPRTELLLIFLQFRLCLREHQYSWELVSEGSAPCGLLSLLPKTRAVAEALSVSKVFTGALSCVDSPLPLPQLRACTGSPFLIYW